MYVKIFDWDYNSDTAGQGGSHLPNTLNTENTYLTGTVYFVLAIIQPF